MANLTTASKELFARGPDECFESLDALARHCEEDRQKSQDLWCPPRDVSAVAAGGPLKLDIANEGAFLMNDWSFTQLCRLARVNKDTVNRLCPETADRVFHETLGDAWNRAVAVSACRFALSVAKADQAGRSDK